MAKQTFYIRGQVNAGHAETYTQNELDLGSYTNLGSSKPEVLRIHNIQCYVSDSTGQYPSMTGDTAGSLTWQLTTQSQSAMVLANDDSWVAGGNGGYRNPDSGTFPPSQAADQTILPQDFQNGYLIAVPSLFIGAEAGTNFTEDVYFTLVMECSTESMSKANAVALAVSQQ